MCGTTEVVPFPSKSCPSPKTFFRRLWPSLKLASLSEWDGWQSAPEDLVDWQACRYHHYAKQRSARTMYCNQNQHERRQNQKRERRHWISRSQDYGLLRPSVVAEG